MNSTLRRGRKRSFNPGHRCYWYGCHPRSSGRAREASFVSSRESSEFLSRSLLTPYVVNRRSLPFGLPAKEAMPKRRTGGVNKRDEPVPVSSTLRRIVRLSLLLERSHSHLSYSGEHTINGLYWIQRVASNDLTCKQPSGGHLTPLPKEQGTRRCQARQSTRPRSPWVNCYATRLWQTELRERNSY